MADKQKRQRAMLDGEIVTVIKRASKARGSKIIVRTGHGFTKQVSASQLKPLDSSDPHAAFEFEDAV